jgi:hypothetical protein
LTGVSGNLVALTWLADGTILCEKQLGLILRISGEDGAVQDTIKSQDNTVWLRGLPVDDVALVVNCHDGSCATGTFLNLLDLQADTARVLLDEVVKAWYAPTGHLVWVRQDGAVFSTPFDLANLEMGDNHQPLLDGVRVGDRWADMVIADDGTVVYVKGTALLSSLTRIVWVDREGQTNPVDTGWEDGYFSTLALSPDGGRLAVDIAGELGRQIWVKELPDGPITRLTADLGSKYWPVWSPDGTSISFHVQVAGDSRLHSAASDGRSAPNHEVLIDLEQPVSQLSFLPDGNTAVFRIGGTAEGGLGLLDLADGKVTEGFLDTEFSERAPAVSPDGKWLAYTSNATGIDEVYVRPFADVLSQVSTVSTNGGTEPVWAPDSRELFFRDKDGWMTVATFSSDSSHAIESRQLLFDASPFRASSNGRNYDVSPSGTRFIMVQRGDSEELADAEASVILMLNWFTQLEEQLAGGS